MFTVVLLIVFCENSSELRLKYYCPSPLVLNPTHPHLDLGAGPKYQLPLIAKATSSPRHSWSNYKRGKKSSPVVYLWVNLPQYIFTSYGKTTVQFLACYSKKFLFKYFMQDFLTRFFYLKKNFNISACESKFVLYPVRTMM